MLRKIGLSLLGALVLIAVVFFAGPRVDVSHTPRSFSIPDDVEAYLAKEESRFPNLSAGAEKKVLWAASDKRRTPLAIVYLHGFSATRQELAPVFDDVARELGANLYYARLTGHGIDGAALAQAKVDDWLADAEEALEVGKRLGDKVIVAGCSTGGTLAAWLAAKKDEPRLAGIVLVSPNFSPKDPSARKLTWPWARVFIPRLVGETMRSKPRSPEHARYWTTEYPTAALFPMMGLCGEVEKLKYEEIRKPLLMIYCPNDQVVNIPLALETFERWGATTKERLPFTPKENETHVIAGDIRAPSGTGPLVEATLRFVRGLER